MLPGTLFSLGIWPANDQTEYQRPIELRFTLDAALVPPGSESDLTIRMYDPHTGQWDRVPSHFREDTYQLVASVQSFTPVAKDFPDWGGRTFFGVFAPSEEPAPTPTGPVVNRDANLRAGPGTVYPVIGFARQGRSVEVTAQNPDGTWYRLAGGEWIAARLVDNAPQVPVVTATPIPPTRTPTQTPTPTPSPRPEVWIRSTGLFVIANNEVLDVDTGELGNLATADILYRVESSGNRSLVPFNSAKTAIVAASAPDYLTCAAARFVQGIVDLELLEPEQGLCVATGEGYIAYLAFPSHSLAGDELALYHTTWAEVEPLPSPTRRAATPTRANTPVPTRTPGPTRTATPKPSPTATDAPVPPPGLATIHVVNRFNRNIRFTLDQRYRGEPGPSEYDLRPGESVRLNVYPGTIKFSTNSPWHGLSGNAGLFVSAGDSVDLLLRFERHPSRADEWVLRHK